MSLFRSSPTRIYYGENRTAVSYDIVVVGTAVAAGMLGIAWLCIGPTCKRKRNTILVNLGYAFAVYIFVVSILGLTCKSWQSGDIYTNASYSAYSPAEVNGTVGLYVGLTSFNVTLKGEPEFQNTTLIDGVNIVEQINYNEIVDFGVRQGRTGYSQYANHVNQEYRRLQYLGVPYPIGSVIELFTNDGDGIRWGRVYRQAGYYAHILLWTSVPVWFLTLATFAAGLWGIRAGFGSEESSWTSNASTTVSGEELTREFRLKSQLRPTAAMAAATGLLIAAAPTVYAIILTVHNAPVRIHFALGDLTLSFGWTWYLTLITGLVLLAMGIGAYVWCTWNHTARLKDINYVWNPRPTTPLVYPSNGHRRGASLSTSYFPSNMKTVSRQLQRGGSNPIFMSSPEPVAYPRMMETLKTPPPNMYNSGTSSVSSSIDTPTANLTSPVLVTPLPDSTPSQHRQLSGIPMSLTITSPYVEGQQNWSGAIQTHPPLSAAVPPSNGTHGSHADSDELRDDIDKNPSNERSTSTVGANFIHEEDNEPPAHHEESNIGDVTLHLDDDHSL